MCVSFLFELLVRYELNIVRLYFLFYAFMTAKCFLTVITDIYYSVVFYHHHPSSHPYHA